MKSIAVICSSEKNSLRFARMICLEIRRAGFEAQIFTDPGQAPDADITVCDADAEYTFRADGSRDHLQTVYYSADPEAHPEKPYVLQRPFPVESLLSLISELGRSVLCERSPQRSVTLNEKEHKVCSEGKEVPLTPLETRLLALLLNHAGEPLSRESIASELWGDGGWDGSTNRVDVYIRYLRKKLELLSERRMIYTVRGRGYVIKP